MSIIRGPAFFVGALIVLLAVYLAYTEKVERRRLAELTEGLAYLKQSHEHRFLLRLQLERLQEELREASDRTDYRQRVEELEAEKRELAEEFQESADRRAREESESVMLEFEWFEFSREVCDDLVARFSRDGDTFRKEAAAKVEGDEGAVSVQRVRAVIYPGPPAPTRDAGMANETPIREPSHPIFSGSISASTMGGYPIRYESVAEGMDHPGGVDTVPSFAYYRQAHDAISYRLEREGDDGMTLVYECSSEASSRWDPVKVSASLRGALALEKGSYTFAGSTVFSQAQVVDGEEGAETPGSPTDTAVALVIRVLPFP